MVTPVLSPPKRDRTRSFSDSRLWLWAFAVFFSLSSVWSLATPLMDAPDEPAHVVRAAGVWYDTVLGTSYRVRIEDPSHGEGVIATGVLTNLRFPRAYDELQTMPQCYMFELRKTADCAPPVSEDMTLIHSASYLGTYQPTYYLLTGWPTRLFSPHIAIRVMRLLSAAICSALLASGMVSAIRSRRSPVVVIGAALAATPMTLFLIGTVNASGLEITAAFATWLGTLEVLRTDTRRNVAAVTRFGIAAMLLTLSRPLASVFLLVALATAVVVAGNLDEIHDLIRAPRMRRWLIALGITTVASGIWVLNTHAWDAFSGFSQPGLTMEEAARTHIHMLGFRTRQLVGYFGNVDAPLPDAFVWLWMGAVGALVVVALIRGGWRQRLGMLAILSFSALVPLMSEVSRAHTYGFIWQGRYSLPFAVGVPIIAGWIIADAGDAADITRRSAWGLAGRIGMVTVAALVSVTMVVAHLAFMTRVAVGYPNPLFDYLSNARWHPPVSEWLLLGVTVAGSLGYFTFLVVHCLDGWRTSASEQ